MRKFVEFIPQESRLGSQIIDPTLVRRLQRNIENSETVTDLYVDDRNPHWLSVMHKLEDVVRALEIQVVPVSLKPSKK